MDITILEALMAEIEPYTAAVVVCKKALMDAGCEDGIDAPYSTDCKKTVAKAAINILKKMLVLSSDSQGKSSQSFNYEGLKKRIKDLCAENGFEADDVLELSSITDGSNLW